MPVRRSCATGHVTSTCRAVLLLTAVLVCWSACEASSSPPGDDAVLSMGVAPRAGLAGDGKSREEASESSGPGAGATAGARFPRSGLRERADSPDGGGETRRHGEEFMTFVHRFGKEKKYCPGDAFPCVESSRREAIFLLNMADVAALNAGAVEEATSAASLGYERPHKRPRMFFAPNAYTDVEKGVRNARKKREGGREGGPALGEERSNSGRVRCPAGKKKT